MKFKTLKTSETGKKFAAIQVKLHEAHEAVVALTEEIGANQWRPAYWVINSGISALFFPEDFQVPRHFKKLHSSKGGGYMPRLDRLEGKLLQKKINSLPMVQIEELNMCVGFKEKIFKTIGYESTNKEYYLFSLKDDWKFVAPGDCEEITVSEYNRLSNNK